MAVASTAAFWPLDVRAGRAWLKSRLSLPEEVGRYAEHAERKAPPAVGSCELPDLSTAHFASRKCSAQKDSEVVAECFENGAGTNHPKSSRPAVTLRDLTFRYAKREPFILKRLSAGFEAGRAHGIVGGNGSGKSTLLAFIAGALKPQLGCARIASGLTLAALPQNVKASFVHDTLGEDLREQVPGITPQAARKMAARLGLEHLLARHPYDLSGGEAQKAALAKLLLLNPDILLLDEPTKGLDALAKWELGVALDALTKEGCTLIMVTHDLSFVAAHTDTCSLLADGDLIATGQTRDFFTGNTFYTTPISRMTQGLLDGCITVDDAITQLSDYEEAS
jgi:energy-coupling factor transport system ATP-binding protein